MKIYKLDINEIADEPFAIASSFRATRTMKASEYYLTEEKAKARQKDIYEGMQKLLGFFPGKVEAGITTIEVIE